MKKAIIASMLTITLSAFAGEVTVSEAHDYGVKENGFRVGTSVAGLSLTATHIDSKYNRYAVGKEVEVTKVGPVALSAGGSVSYQDTVRAKDGYGLTVGAKATLPITKSVDLVAGAERFVGQNRVSSFNGNVGTIGLTAKF